MKISEILQILMDKAGYSQNTLAQLTELNQPTIQRILDGSSKDPKTDTIAPLASFFGLTVAQLRGQDSIPGLNELGCLPDPIATLADGERKLITIYRELGRRERESLMMMAMSLPKKKVKHNTQTETSRHIHSSSASRQSSAERANDDKTGGDDGKKKRQYISTAPKKSK